MPNQRLQHLFDLYVQGSCTPAEKRELYALALALQHEADVRELLDAYWNTQVIEFRMGEEKADGIVQSILENEATVAPRVRRIHFRPAGWWAAAAILILLATGSYFLFFTNKGNKPNAIVTTETKDVKAPETNRAMITLADGSTVYLDSAGNGQLAVQGNMKLVKLANGQIAYETTNGKVLTEIKYNTLSNPRGSKVIDMALADGSHVWLNAGSSLRYPVAFVGSERKVEITGEAYFEVAHDASKPFKVIKGDVEVNVLGTHFNVNAYDDERDMKVTLLEGSVEVKGKNSKFKIRPGQQAMIMNNEQLAVNNNVDLEEVMAWKNDKFQFNRANVETIMREVARWYDIEVIYSGKVPAGYFRGEISRSAPVSQTLKILESSGMKIKIEGRHVKIE